MTKTLTILIAVASTILAALLPVRMSAQDYSIESFRELPNDISAFINPVKDLNDEGCALLKVIGVSPDFAFSTPLGIVKRIDKTGEIWLYLPRGSKKFTIKHAEWGVMRDYAFPSKLESHRTYELSIKEPVNKATAPIATPVVKTVRDTLVLTRVDTFVVTPVKPKIPIEADILATTSLGGKATYLTWGVMAAVMKRHGAYMHISTNFGATGKIIGVCDRYGMIDGSERYYSGRTRRKAYMVTVGAIHRCGRHIGIFEGIGYSSGTLAWQLADSEGGGYVRNSYYSCKGLTAEVGIMLKLNKLTISASALTLKGNEWFGTIGIGLKIGKKTIK